MRTFATRLLFVGLVLALTACGDKNKKSDDDKGSAPVEPHPAPTGQPRAFEPIMPTDLPEDLAPLANLEELVQRIGLKPYHDRGYRAQNLKIAVLDNGFAGLKYSIGKRLPPDTKLMPSPRAEMQDTSHGTKLAEIAYALATGSAKYDARKPGPKMLLFNANGYTNFTAAIDRAVREKVDVVLYAQVWEYGGNFDGQGFINQEVRRATNQGILWVNAAGNFGQTTYHGPVKVAAGTGVRPVELPYEGKYVRFTVPQDDTPVKIVLSWNDFDDSKDFRTKQDLDLILEGSDGREIAVSRMLQDGVDPNAKPQQTTGQQPQSLLAPQSNGPATSTPAPAAPGVPATPGAQQSVQRSAHARELIATGLPAGTYRLRVEAKSNNFDDQSSLRITIDGLGVRVLDGSKQDTVLIPADSSSVLTVGASDVDYSANSDTGARRKPELMVNSEIRFEGGASVRGTSAATGIAVGAFAVFKSAYGLSSLDDVIKQVEAGNAASRDPALCQAARQVSGVDPCERAPILKLVDPSSF